MNIAILTEPAHNAPPMIRMMHPISIVRFLLRASADQALSKQPSIAPALLTPFRAPMMLVV